MLVPLLGEAIARRLRRLADSPVRIATGVFVVIATGRFVASKVRFDWLGRRWLRISGPDRDPNMAVVDWTSLRTELEKRGLLDRPGL